MKPLSEEDKKQIYNILAESYIDLVSKGIIGKFERKVVSQKILDSVEKAQTYQEIYTFLDSMIKTYPDFNAALIRVRSEINKVHEDQVIDQLQHFIHSS